METRRKIGYVFFFLLLGSFTAASLTGNNGKNTNAIAMVAAHSDQERPIVTAVAGNSRASIGTGGEICELTGHQLKTLSDQYEIKTDVVTVNGREIIIAKIKGENLDRSVIVSKVGDLGNCVVVKNRHSVILISPFEVS